MTFGEIKYLAIRDISKVLKETRGFCIRYSAVGTGISTSYDASRNNLPPSSEVFPRIPWTKNGSLSLQLSPQKNSMTLTTLPSRDSGAPCIPCNIQICPIPSSPAYRRVFPCSHPVWVFLLEGPVGVVEVYRIV